MITSKMTEDSLSQYSAAASLLGYIYQCRLALFETLKRLKTNPDIAVTIESLDDVVFERNGTPSDIIQVKHRINRKANLTDTSTDLWKSIRIWCDLYHRGFIKENGAILCLMTTETAAQNSAASFLRSEGRNIQIAYSKLLQTVQTSSSATNKDAYSRFLGLAKEAREALLNSILILDNCPLNKDLDQYLKQELWGFCNRTHAVQFLNYLEGWWLRRIIRNFDSQNQEPITGDELDSQLNALRDQFKSEALPIHDDISHANPDVSLFKNWMFSRQLRLINVNERRIEIAAKNFYKASEQRSRWIREDLLIDGDLDVYDENLKEEWTVKFEQAIDGLPPNPTDSERVKVGQVVYQWVEADADLPIRPKCQERFITRGSFQMLSNRMKVGWHPDYKTLLTLNEEEQE